MAATERLRPWFAALGYVVPDCRVSCGFASTGLRSGHIGQCWSRAASDDGINQVFISPVLDDAVEVLETVPMLRKFIHMGPPLCPEHKVALAPLGDWDDI